MKCTTAPEVPLLMPELLLLPGARDTPTPLLLLLLLLPWGR